MIRGYDTWLTNILPRQVAARRIYLADGSYVVLEEINYIQPTFTDNKKPLYPKDALHNMMDYSLRISAKAVQYSAEGELMKVHDELADLGAIPLMLGSKYCYLSSMSEDERIAYSTMPKDPLGYFIVKGVERVVLLQEQLRTGRVTLMRLKDDIVARITAMIDRGSYQGAVSINKNGVVQFKMPSFCSSVDNPDAQQMPVLQIFRFFGLSVEDATAMISWFIPKEQIQTCLLYMIPSIAALRANENMRDYNELAEEYEAENDVEEEGNPYDLYPRDADDMISMGDVDYIAKKLYKTIPTPVTRGKKKADDPRRLCKTEEHYKQYQSYYESPAVKIQRVFEAINNDLFPYMNLPAEQSDPEAQGYIRDMKLQLLAYMIARRLMYANGTAQLDDRNHWGNKKLESAGKMMDQLFRTIFRIIITMVQSRVDEKRETSVGAVVNYIKEKTGKITQTFETSFTSSTWGVTSIIKKNNAAIQLQVRQSCFCSFASSSYQCVYRAQ